MSLAIRHDEQKSVAGGNFVEAARYCCLHARRLEDAGDFEAARNVLGDPWAGFSLRDEVRQNQQRFIELAIRDAGGSVSRAARLLGFKHHESLRSLINNRFQHLSDARAPERPRRRSIIRK